MYSFIEQFNGQEGIIWISSWHLFFINVYFSLPVCSLSNIPYSSSTTFAFPCYFIFLLLGTSLFLLLLLLLLPSFKMFLVKTIETFKILSSLVPVLSSLHASCPTSHIRPTLSFHFLVILSSYCWELVLFCCYFYYFCLPYKCSW